MSGWQFREVRVQVATRDNSNVFAVLLLPLLCAVGFLGNILVCIAIWTDRRLHTVTNYFLFSLAFADLLVCSVVMPLSLLVEVKHGIWTWSFSMCLLYVYLDVFLCTASIVHMSVISLDRYLGISKPLKSRNITRTMIIVKITCVWIITVVISSPIAVAAIIDPSNILQQNTCNIANRYYMIYGSTFAFLIPFIIMAVTYVKTTSLLNAQASQLSHKATDKCNGNGLRRTLPKRKLRTISSFDGISFNDKEDRRTIHSSLAVLPVSGSKDSKDEQIQTSSFAGRQEDRLQATRVLAVVFGCFFVCWTPFFAANFAVGFCGRACSVPPAIASLFLWLGYGSSTLNPLIYTAFNKRFRQAFLRVLRCQCLLPIRTSEMSRHSRTNIPLDNQTSTFDRSFAMRSSCRSENTYWKTGSCRDFSFPVGSRSVEQSTLHVSNSEVRPLLIWHSEENPSTNLESQKNELQVQVPDTLLSRSSSLIVFHDSENARKPTDRHLLMEKSPSLQQSSAGECKTSGTHSPIGNLSNEIIDECDNSLSPKTQTTDDTDRQNTDAIDQAMDETFV